MGKEESFHHRATLKQKNKSFKSKHATKTQLKDKNKGKTQRTPVKGKMSRIQRKADRRNYAKIEQRKKRDEQAMIKRLFTGRNRAPKLVAMIPLCQDVQPASLVENMYQSLEAEYDPSKHICTLDTKHFKQDFKIIQLQRNFLDIVEAAKVADYIVFVMSALQEVDDFGKSVLTAIQAQGAPSVLSLIQHDSQIKETKQLVSIKKSLLSFINYYFPAVNQIHSCSNIDNSVQFVRTVANTIPETISWRKKSPYIVADNLNFIPDPSSVDQTSQQLGDLEITGFLRGANLSPDRLIHIPGHGNFQIKSIVLNSNSQDDIKAGSEIGSTSFYPIKEKQDSLVCYNAPDTTANEQPLIDESEMENWKSKMQELEEKESEILRKKTKRVPKESDALMVDKNSVFDANDIDIDANDSDYHNSTDDEEYDEVEIDEHGNVIDPDNAKYKKDEDDLPDAQDTQKQLEEYLKLKAKQSENDLEFPDEVDTPLDVPAHIRFAKFRGLQSFRTSPWDPYENLPIDYARIFQLENPKNMVLSSVPQSVYHSFNKNKLFAAFSLLPHENKFSVLHFIIKRHQDYEEPVRSKDEVILMCGFRRMVVRPLYSQFGGSKSSSNNVRKFERFLQNGSFSIGTVYAPVCFGNDPVLMYLPDNFEIIPSESNINQTDSSMEIDSNLTTNSSQLHILNETLPTLIGTGSVYSVDPTRILAKRIVLTGIPYKINKRKATIRFMFYNPIDINYFKPIQLSTKYGRHGHIIESLGTHGYMKCVFNGGIKAMDTICLNLYKRVFPKWDTKLL
ncbi:hypothetical protein BB561_002577 [Smittium simulii]|uniref:Bms1-type G domain-containing protein n=1 Tax=Smittium simulii TaxID=133385 RepID=A0A2T9YPX6_9FUNG|nr:hypothetical protein BB561_002577 [Smittium simulii]